MKQVLTNYTNELKRCLTFKGEITNKDFVLYLLINMIIIGAITSFVAGFYEGYTNEPSSIKMTLFGILFILTTTGIVFKKINTFKIDRNR